MKRKNIRVLALIVFLITAISIAIAKDVEKKEIPIEDVVIYTRDKYGVYLYNLKNRKTAEIYKCTDKNEIFVEKEFRFIDDYVIVGIKGDHEFQKKFTEEYIAIKLDGSNFWKHSRKTYHEFWDKLLLRVFELNYSTNEEKLISETELKGSGTSYKGIEYNIEWGYSESNPVNGITAYTDSGDLYLKDADGRETLLLDYPGELVPKFLKGYYDPVISPDGNKVLFTYVKETKSFLDFFLTQPELQELDLETKKVKTLRRGSIRDPKYSPSGKYILYMTGSKFNEELKTFTYDICIMDVRERGRKRIGKGDIADWIQ